MYTVRNNVKLPVRDSVIMSNTDITTLVSLMVKSSNVHNLNIRVQVEWYYSQITVYPSGKPSHDSVHFIPIYALHSYWRNKDFSVYYIYIYCT